jgi:hypothetical protein
MVSGLVQTFGGSSAENAAHGGTGISYGRPFNLDFYTSSYQRLKQKDPDKGAADRPKAYLSFVLFDDDFKLIEDTVVYER